MENEDNVLFINCQVSLRKSALDNLKICTEFGNFASQVDRIYDKLIICSSVNVC